MADQAAKKLLAELESFNNNVPDLKDLDPILRAKVISTIRQTNSLVASPADKVAQLMLENPNEASVVHTAADLGIFSSIHKAGPLTVGGIAEATGADKALITRLARTLSAVGALQEVGGNKFDISPSFSLFRDRKFEQCFGPCSDFMNNIFRPIPKYLDKTGYKNSTNPLDTVIQYGFDKPNKHFYQIFGEQPHLHTHFSTLMSLWSDGWLQFQEVYPVKEVLIDGYDPSAGAVFVDVGGNWGQQTLALKEKFPQLKGRFVVQDLYSISAAPKDDPRYAGIEWQAHDFFQPQTERDARIYYIRNCLHNWEDESCVKILSQVRAAMKEGYSKVVIHEFIMPERGAGTWVTTQDIEMMAMFGSAERTEEEYRELLGKAGLRLIKKYQNDNPNHESLIEAEI